MRLTSNNILLIIVFLLSAGLTFKVTQYFNDKKLEDVKVELRKSKLRNDKLKKIEDGLYTKLVADSLKKKELQKVVDSLELKVKNPKIVTRIVTRIDTIEKPVDGIVVKDSVVELEDHYPNKENPFLKYKARIDLKTEQAIGTFTFTKLKISLGIGQNEDGTYYLNTKLPDYFNVESVDVQALPLEPTKRDQFGVIIGGGVGRDFRPDGVDFMYFETGVRLNKVYLKIGGTSNSTAYGGFAMEF